MAVHRERARLASGAAVIGFVIAALVGLLMWDLSAWLTRTFGDAAGTIELLLTIAAFPATIGIGAFCVAWLPARVREWSESADIRYFQRHGEWPDDGNVIG